MTVADPLAPARDAVERGDWQTALDQLGVGRDRVTPADDPHLAAALELEAQAAYGDGRFEAAVSAWEDLHAHLDGLGDRAGAARAAAMVAMYLMMDTGLMAPVRGWLRRAERLLEGVAEAPAHAVMEMVRTYERFMCGDMETSRRHAEAAIDLGQRLGVQPAVVIGRVATARLTIFEGRVEEGLELLDEVGALLMSNRVDPLTTGMMYCELICAAQGLALHDRATEWTDVMERWRHGAAFGGINGRCRVHRAELLRITGPCDLAEAEALAACDELRPWMRREFGWPLVELGTIRLRRGDLDGAEEAFLAAHEHAWSPQPGLALLRLEQGETGVAAALIADAVSHPLDIPSKERPPFGDLRLAPLLDAQVEIALAAGDPDTARVAADALAVIADSYASPSLRACSSLAQGRIALHDGDFVRAIERCREAVAVWTEVGAPFETATARTVLGHAHTASGDRGGARIEWEAARAGYEAFGASHRAESVGALPVPVPGPAPAPPAVTDDASRSAKAGDATFRRDGDSREIGFGGVLSTVRDLKGYRYLERLLAEPGREFHVLDLVAAEQGTLPVGTPRLVDRNEAEPIGGAGAVGGGLPVLDDAARDAYRRRLAEVDADIEEATAHNDLGRVALAERDRDYLIAELRHAVGLGGRHRSVGSSGERARTSVTRSIRYALAKLAEVQPVTAAHLTQCVATGTYCSYALDPLAPITWQT